MHVIPICYINIQDWESMVSLLLDDKCGISLIDEEEGVLIEIMTCAVCKATGVSPPAGRGRGRVSTFQCGLGTS